MRSLYITTRGATSSTMGGMGNVGMAPRARDVSDVSGWGGWAAASLGAAARSHSDNNWHYCLSLQRKRPFPVGIVASESSKTQTIISDTLQKHCWAGRVATLDIGLTAWYTHLRKEGVPCP